MSHHCQCLFTAPHGLDSPHLTIVNRTALRVIWKAPKTPNGQIIAYNLYVDDHKISTGMITSGSYILSHLQPFQIYTVKVSSPNSTVVSRPPKKLHVHSLPVFAWIGCEIIPCVFGLSQLWRLGSLQGTMDN